MKITLLNSIPVRILFFIALFFIGTKSNAQTPTISPQNLTVTNICAGDIVNGSPFNEYYATFTYTDFPSDVDFQIEISDASGSFLGTTTITTKLDTEIISSTQQRIKFAIPTNFVGSDTYGIRVKSNKTVNSQKFKNFIGNSSFSIYYKDYVSAFYINNQVSTATICSGGSLTLSVDNPTPTVKNSSPANYSNIKYKWYKDNVVISGQTAASYTATSAGEYYAELDYGLCSDSNFSSNRVVISTSGSGSSVTISSSLGNPFCSNGDGTVLTATNGNSFIWKKNNNVITGATTRNYKTNEAGIYTVDVNFGGCTASGTIDLKGSNFEAKLYNLVNNEEIVDNLEIKLPDNENLNVGVTTDAVNPTYSWFLNNSEIASATSDQYLVAVKGNYKVKISTNNGCVMNTEINFKVSAPSDNTATVIPNIISLSNYPYWDIPAEYVNANTNVMIVSSQGEVMFNGADYDSSKWQIKDFKSVNPVYYYIITSDSGVKKGSITVIR